MVVLFWTLYHVCMLMCNVCIEVKTIYSWDLLLCWFIPWLAFTVPTQAMCISKLYSLLIFSGGERCRNWLRHCATNVRFRVRFLVGSLEIFKSNSNSNFQFLPFVFSILLGPFRFELKWVPRNFSGGKGRPASRAYICRPICAACHSNDGSPTFYRPL